MLFDWFMAVRYLKEGRIQTALILLAVAVGVGVTVFLTALINGLQASIVDRVLGTQPHITIEMPEKEPARSAPAPAAIAEIVQVSPQRERIIPEWQKVQILVQKTYGVQATAPTVSGPAFAVRGSAQRSVVLKGTEDEAANRILNLSTKLVKGRYSLQGNYAMIGTELAKKLGISLGDKFRLTTTTGSELFILGGLLDFGIRDANERWVYTSLPTAQTLLDFQDGITSLEVRIADIFKADTVADEIHRQTNLKAESWIQATPELMTALKSQDSSSFIIRFFVTIATALGISSVLAVSVVQKSREIGILKAVGSSTSHIMRIFLLEGALVGFIGATVGSLVGMLLGAVFQKVMTTRSGEPLFPIDVSVELVAVAIVVATLVGTLSAVIPARRAAKLDPAGVIRYG